MRRGEVVVQLLTNRLVTALIVAAAALPMLFCGFYGLTVIQRAVFPIVLDFKVTRHERLNPKRIEIWGSFNKLYSYGDGLAACRYVDTVWWAESAEGHLTEIRWWTLERPFGQKVNRQPGVQNFGPWIIDYANEPKADRVYAIVSHICFGFWPTETKLGPLELVPPK